MLKKFSVIVALLFIIIMPLSVYADEEIKLNVDGVVIELENKPVIIDGRVFVPLRPLCESLGFTLEWDDQTKTVTEVYQPSGGNLKKQVTMQVGSKVKNVLKVTNIRDNISTSEDVTMDVAPIIIDNTIYVPASYAVEDLNCKAYWSGTNRTLYVFNNMVLSWAYPGLYKLIPGSIMMGTSSKYVWCVWGYPLEVLTDGTVDEYINLLKDNGFTYSTENIGSETLHVLTENEDPVTDFTKSKLFRKGLKIYIGRDVIENVTFVATYQYSVDEDGNIKNDYRPEVEEYLTTLRNAANGYYEESNNELGIDNERFTAIENIFESYVDRISKCTTNDEAIAIANEISNRTSDYEYYISNPLSSNEMTFAQNAMLISNYIALCKSADIIVEKASKLTNKTIESEKSFDIAVKMGRLIFDASDMSVVKQVEYELRSSLTSMVSGFQSALQ